MESLKGEILLLVLMVWAFMSALIDGTTELQLGFYGISCPQAEMVVREEVSMALRDDAGLAAGLLRMHFHDCFVKGCDGSVLIDSTPSNRAEKDSPANNPSLRGFHVIDSAKSRLEAACPEVVSCADILAFAARDSIVMAGGVEYQVPAGRRDGRVSLASETFANLPGPNSNLRQLTQSFANKGFTQDEMVTLSGAHTIGRAHCGTFSSRLYNNSGTASQDPNLEPYYAEQLKQQCPQGSTDASLAVPMDPWSPDELDTSYYANVLENRGLFASDQALLTDPATAAQVRLSAFDSFAWSDRFAQAMLKMGQIGVLTGSDGEIRLNCRVIN
ncbi:Peroxidase 5 [Apostasia shenzhenica]|uniref:Peroxidase n=1 Tax=Apostasia shenzhenica TaxID=1088818 RepID=A0A2H9ZTF7_9ASPA|nr:Peroxidase 5 [Apostasia shenzhenica]